MTTTEMLLDVAGGGPPFGAVRPEYQLRLATSESDVIAAQRLRYRIFTLEGGASTPGPAGIDADESDDRCDHLIVWHTGPVGEPQAVATLRLLPPHSNDAAPRGAGLDADRLFGLMPLERLLDATVEVGRACVRADHRGGAAISLLWGGVARYLHLTGYRYLLGCLPVGLDDGGRSAASCWDLALTRHLASADRRCRPRDPIPIGGLERADHPDVPALVRGCLRLGATVCGPPSYDPMFDTASFLVLLDLRAVDMRYLRGFLRADG